MTITPIPAFEDNYIWLLGVAGSDQVAVVDPGDADPVIDILHTRGLQLAAVLITHHHGDHTGGLADLLALWPRAEAIGPLDRRIRGLTQTVGEGARVTLPGLGTGLRVLAVPGHTATHIAYLSDDGDLFCGDTLFAAGCGRVFDGSLRIWPFPCGGSRRCRPPPAVSVPTNTPWPTWALRAGWSPPARR
jgi:hydroxyacylglutathione hydrolase